MEKLKELSVKVRVLTPDILKSIFTRYPGHVKLRLVCEVLRPFKSDVEDTLEVCRELGGFELLDTFGYDEVRFYSISDAVLG